MIPKSGSLIDFNVQANLTGWTEANFKGVPYFENLNFSGPLNSEINLFGNRHSFKFKNKLDLTQTVYKFQDVIHKKENNMNKVEMEGTYSEEEGIAVDQFKFILDNNSFTGKGNIKNLADPKYLIKVDGIGFEA